MKGDLIIIELLAIIAIGSFLSVYMFVDWQGIILGVMFLLGFISWREPAILPWFLYPLEPIIKLFAIAFLLIMVYMAYDINEMAERIKEERNNA